MSVVVSVPLSLGVRFELKFLNIPNPTLHKLLQIKSKFVRALLDVQMSETLHCVLPQSVAGHRLAQ